MSFRSPKGLFGCAPVLLFLVAPACGSDDSSGDEDASVPDGGVDAGVDAAVVPAFRNRIDTPDAELGAEVLVLLGAPVEGARKSCDRCHGMTREALRTWEVMGDDALTGCLTDLEVADPASARAMIDCLRIKPSDPESSFTATRLGVFTTAADLPWFRFLFSLAYGEEGPALHAEFVERVGMPRGDAAPLNQEEFDRIAEYFDRGLPELDSLLEDEPGTTDCTLEVSELVTEHVSEMSQSGWRANNTARDLLMFGCGGAATPRDCLAGRPRVTAWESLAGTAVRRLAEVDYESAYWTRSSADGRFVAHGVQAGASFQAAFVDLQTGATIPADASYDPGFFPDNSGFAFQPPAYFCDQSILAAGPDEITFEEPGCSAINQVGLYQHIGASLDGDYWAVDSQFTSDNGGHEATLSDPAANFGSTAFSSLTPMIHDGNAYEPGTTIEVENPNEGDVVLSPSARLLVSRVRGARGRQNGFTLRRVDATATPDGYEVEMPAIARYCVNGGKPGFSYDERWMAYHHYVEPADAVELGFEGADDPAFAPYLESGAANVYLLDLETGESLRVTGMPAGQYALFPHFRSDGWIYFIVREVNGSVETIAATDAALVLEE